jgi:hypothetical protein
VLCWIWREMFVELGRNAVRRLYQISSSRFFYCGSTCTGFYSRSTTRSEPDVVARFRVPDSTLDSTPDLLQMRKTNRKKKQTLFTFQSPFLSRTPSVSLSQPFYRPRFSQPGTEHLPNLSHHTWYW